MRSRNTVAGLATVFVLAYLMVLQGPRLVDSALGQMSEAPATLRTRCAGDCGRAVTSYMTGNLLISVICGTRLGGVPVVPVRQPRLCCLQRRSGWGPAAIGGPDLPNAGQRFGDVVISGLAHVDAPHIVTSAEIEEQLAPTMERMRIRTGLLAGVGGHGARHLTDVPESALLHSGQAGEQPRTDPHSLHRRRQLLFDLGRGDDVRCVDVGKAGDDHITEPLTRVGQVGTPNGGRAPTGAPL